jgi:TRAP-type C4-dicarboxylate transport system permease small subunit
VHRDHVRQMVKLCTGILTVILSAWMTLWAIRYFLATLQRGAMSLEIGIQMAWVHAAMPLGLVLMTFYFALELLEDLGKLRAGARR